MKAYLRVGIILIGTGIILGALGAHALKDTLTVARLASFKTAVLYQLLMGLGILLLCSLRRFFLEPRLKWSLKLISTGCLLFSGSIYALVYLGTVEAEAGKAFLGPLTPVGGLLLILGWFLLVFSLDKEKK